MNLLAIVLPSAVVLVVAYLTYGRVLARLLRLDPDATTPAVELRDGIDFEPLRASGAVAAAFFGDRGGGADRGADSGRADVRLAAGADLDSRRLDL